MRLFSVDGAELSADRRAHPARREVERTARIDAGDQPEPLAKERHVGREGALSSKVVLMCSCLLPYQWEYTRVRPASLALIRTSASAFLSARARKAERFRARLFMRRSRSIGGLLEATHAGPSIIDFQTLTRSENPQSPFFAVADCQKISSNTYRLCAIRLFSSIRALPATQQRISCLPIGCAPICRTKAFDAGARRMICPSAPRPGMQLTKRSGDFRLWKKPAEYQKSLYRLLRDLKASEAK